MQFAKCPSVPAKYAASAGARKGIAMGLLCMIARSKRVAESAVTRCVATEEEPADCPKIVTRAASPPNAPIFARTHASERRWSRMP